MTAEEINRIPFFFIVGIGRSGTTMLQSLLDANEEVILPLESSLIMYLKQKYFRTKNWSNKKIDELILDLHLDIKFKYLWKIDYEKLRNDLYKLPEKSRNFTLICRQIYLNYPSIFNKEKIKIIGDKNPKYSIFVKELLDIFPDAKFIHLVRDYRSNVASNKKTFNNNNVALLAHKWEMYNRNIEKQKAKKPTAFYTLKYEDFVVDPEKYTKEICTFLNIIFLPEMFNFYEKTSKYFEDTHARFAIVHPHLTEPINDNNMDKWKKELSEKEQKVIDYIAGDYAAKYGYVKEYNEKNLKLFFLFLTSYKQNWVDVRVLKTYYKLPFFIRKNISFFSKKIYDWFGYTTRYSMYDLNSNFSKFREDAE
ncbi:MAG TPA: sulfotransferase [Bacteroidia bacterium]|nr:sulfotransferase [Bacteroidia bacterium]